MLAQQRQYTGGVTEQNFIIREALRNGLSPDARMPRNAPYASEMLNLMASEFGAVTQNAITNPITNGPSPNWSSDGTVQMFMGEAGRFVLGQTRAYKANESWVASAIGSTFTAGGPWQFVSFLEYTVFTNGTVFFFSPVGATATPTQHTTPTINAVGKDGNRLLLGGMAGDCFSQAPFTTFFQRWKDTQTGDRLSYSDLSWGTGWVMYSGYGGDFSDYPFALLFALLGRYTFPADKDTLNQMIESWLEQYKIGICPLRYPGEVRAFHEMNGGTLVFGKNGVARLARDNGLYMDTRIHKMGVAGRGAVGGTLDECVFVDTAMELWRISGEGLTSLGFAAHIGTLTAANITISHDPSEGAYYIADKAKGYILRGNTLSGPFEVFPSSVVRDNGSLYGVIRDTRSDTSKTVVRFRSNPLDMNERGTKQLTCIQVAREKITSLVGGCDYRNDDEAASYTEGPRTQSTKEGAIFLYPRREFSDGKIVIQGNVANGTTGVIEQIECRYQKSDKTFVRGTKGTPEVG
jgi:hypothetical protein